ncbi:MAG: hypothetical protein U0836_08675 [Pirellulales bacterium]
MIDVVDHRGGERVLLGIAVVGEHPHRLLGQRQNLGVGEHAVVDPQIVEKAAPGIERVSQTAIVSDGPGGVAGVELARAAGHECAVAIHGHRVQHAVDLHRVVLPNVQGRSGRIEDVA